jgi:hypothetical protein
MLRGGSVYPPPCDVCKGVKEVQCPACHGKPMYEEGNGNPRAAIAEGKNHDFEESKREKRGRGGTHYQSLLAIHYLLKSANAADNNTKKADFAAFLSGFSKHTLRQTWSDIHRRAEINGTAWENDMKMVRRYFEELGLSDVIKFIDDDLASQSE